MININWQPSVVKLDGECMLHHCQKLDLTLDYLGQRFITETIDQRNSTRWWALWAFSFPFHSDIGKQHHCCRFSAQTYFGGWMLVAPLTPTQNSLSSKTTNIYKFEHCKAFLWGCDILIQSVVPNTSDFSKRKFEITTRVKILSVFKKADRWIANISKQSHCHSMFSTTPICAQIY